MDTSIIGLIVIAAIVVVLLVAAIAWIRLTKPRQHRHDSDTIPEDVDPREALEEAIGDQVVADGRGFASVDNHREETP